MNGKLTLEWCFKYYNARIIIADTTTFANVRCMGIPNSPQALDALEKYGQLQLRPLSSLTDEEKEYIEKIYMAGSKYEVIFTASKHCQDIIYSDDIDILDYLRSINIHVGDLPEGVYIYE